MRAGEYGAGEGEDLLALGGIAAAGDRVYVLGAGVGRVVVLDGEMRMRSTFGRPGRGPGELVRSTMPTSHGGTQRWIAASGDTVVVFDGERVVFFGADGTPGATWSPERVRGSSPMQSRIALSGGDVLFSAGGYDFSRGGASPVFTLWSTSGARPRQLAALPLPKLPGRLPTISSEQARPAGTQVAAASCSPTAPPPCSSASMALPEPRTRSRSLSPTALRHRYPRKSSAPRPERAACRSLPLHSASAT